jgi:RNA polymerase sigma factor (sigma-70 family)
MNFESHRPGIYAVCLKVLRHAQDAEDATQEALLKAARGGPDVRDVDAWLHRIAFHAALDVLRRRRTRERHEGNAAPSFGRAADGRIEALYSALADLPEDDRRVLVEHFIQEKSLREMARPEGCSEVAVWKRIGRAKDRLRQALALAGAGAAFALLPREGFGAASVPVVAIKVAVAAAAVLLVGAGVAVRSQPSATSPATTSPVAASRRALPTEFKDTPVRPAMKTAGPPSPKAAPAVSRPTYPYRFPPPYWSAALSQTWQALRTKRMTIDQQNEPAENILAEISTLSGVPITVAPGIDGGTVSFKVADIVLDGALRLMLQPRGLAYEVLEDGSILVDAHDRVSSRIAGEAHGIESVRSALEDVRRRLDQGWDGLDHQDPTAVIEEKLRTSRWISPQDGSSGEQRLADLRQTGRINLLLDAAVDPEVRQQLGESFVSPVEDGTLEDHLDRLCSRFGLGFSVTQEEVVLVSSRKNAEEGRKAQALERAFRAETRAKLERPIPASLPPSIPDLIQALERALEIEVRVSEKVWDSLKEFRVPAGATGREALQQICAQGGFRWALDGRVYLVE